MYRICGAKHIVVRAVATMVALGIGSSYPDVFYVDPASGSIDNDGSSGAPWSTLEEAFDAGKIKSRDWASKPPESSTQLVGKNTEGVVGPGDTIMLRTGYHGRVSASGYYNEDYITIMAHEGHTPQLAAIELRSGCRWRLQGLTISPSFADSMFTTTLINFSSHGWHGTSYECIAKDNEGYSVDDVSGWSKDDRNALPSNALSLPARSVARNNHFRNVDFGISSGGDSVLVEYNTVENFSGDGLRGLGDYQVFQYNTVRNCYDVNDNHDDGFQSWSSTDAGIGTGVVKGMVLRGNTIVNYTDPNQTFRGTLQGIGCFDGMFEDWVVENNVIMVDHWHGISLYGATGCRVVNNTVVDLNAENPGPPWIKITEHKTGASPEGCVVRNNLCGSISCSNVGVTIDHNMLVENHDDYFVDYAAGDLHLKADCAAIGAGSSDLAPDIDKDKVSRPQGDGIDVGAYEFGAAESVLPSRVTLGVAPLSTRRRAYDLRGMLLSGSALRAPGMIVRQGQSRTAGILLFR